jgi:hypothetical protein
MFEGDKRAGRAFARPAYFTKMKIPGSYSSSFEVSSEAFSFSVGTPGARIPQ